MKIQVIVVLLFLFTSYTLYGQQTTINYINSAAEIANPERGWYHHTQTRDAGYAKLRAQVLTNYRESENITLILRLYYLDGFVDQENVSEEYLTNMQSDFDSIRTAGIKCILRFAYSSSQSAEVWDATPEIVFSHIESLTDVLQANSDVIATVQAGFVGVWGEWYYTRNFAGMNNIPDETDQQNRRLLVEKVLSVFPENIVVQGRTPAIMRNIVQSEEPISESEAFNCSVISRVGHHNDCFLANITDYGTYLNIEADIEYLQQATKYTISGGETCDASNDYSNCENGLDKMKTLHWTYLNRDYNKNVYNKWEDQGCYDEINIALGYRIYLKTATIDNSVLPGSKLNLSFTFSNVGFAAPTQFKPIQLVLTHTETGQQTFLYYEGINDDVRYWLPGEISLNGNVVVPDSVIDGNYAVSLIFPDQDVILAQNAAYSIQLANVGVWNAELGTNSLNHIVSIGIGGIGALPEVPEISNSTALSETEIELLWTDNLQDHTGYEIMRSRKNDQKWVLIAELDADETNYIDSNLDEGTLYNYIIRSKNEYGTSNWSNINNVTTLGVSGINSNSSSFSVYPNPLLESHLNIKFDKEAPRQIKVYNISGHLIYSQTTRGKQTILNYSIFKRGIYHLKVIQDDGIVLTSKISVY